MGGYAPTWGREMLRETLPTLPPSGSIGAREETTMPNDTCSYCGSSLAWKANVDDDPDCGRFPNHCGEQHYKMERQEIAADMTEDR